MSAQRQVQGTPFTEIAGFVFNLNTMIAVDLTGYEQGKDGRKVMFVLLGPHTHTFEGTRADDAFLWYLEISGQARVQPARGPILAQ